MPKLSAVYKMVIKCFVLLGQLSPVPWQLLPGLTLRDQHLERKLNFQTFKKENNFSLNNINFVKVWPV